jgi:C-methyltransferase C-terminal domain/Putative zinc binding domain/Methyltransferase domain
VDRVARAESHHCRWCRSADGEIVLDLGHQPAADNFPRVDDPGPDPVYPLQMWLCAACGLAQLLVDPTVPEEPRGAEPAALVEQAADAVGRVAAAGWLRPGARAAEYGSPHGGSWQALLATRGLTPVGDDEPADVVLDCFGLMHSTDQAAALAERAARLAPGGVLLVQYHSLAAIMRFGQWNSLRHGHYAYYSTTALCRMLASAGVVPRQAWHFELYGGTVLLAATRGDANRGDARDPTADPTGVAAEDAGAARAVPDPSVRRLLADEAALGVEDPDRVRSLQQSAASQADRLHRWLVGEKAAGRTVLGYGAASRAVALLCRADVDSGLLPAVADASPAKQSRRMPATDIPVVAPGELIAARPDAVVLFLPDLMGELRGALPEIQAAGGRWVTVESLGRSQPAAG